MLGSSCAHTEGQPGQRDSSHLTRASPLRTAPVSTASTSCSPAPTASRAQWKVACGGRGAGEPHTSCSPQTLPRSVLATRQQVLSGRGQDSPRCPQQRICKMLARP